MKFRDIKWLVVVKCFWLAAVISIWELGLGSCITDLHCSVAREYSLPLLVLFSFPISLFLLSFGAFVVNSGLTASLDPALEYTLLAFTMIVGGSVQWFRIIPAIFGNQKLTVLSLQKAKILDLGIREPTPPQLSMNPVPSAQILHFDERGKTPLERAIGKRQRRRPTSAS
jgi:hypothetical protein